MASYNATAIHAGVRQPQPQQKGLITSPGGTAQAVFGRKFRSSNDMASPHRAKGASAMQDSALQEEVSQYSPPQAQHYHLTFDALYAEDSQVLGSTEPHSHHSVSSGNTFGLSAQERQEIQSACLQDQANNLLSDSATPANMGNRPSYSAGAPFFDPINLLDAYGYHSASHLSRVGQGAPSNQYQSEVIQKGTQPNIDVNSRASWEFWLGFDDDGIPDGHSLLESDPTMQGSSRLSEEDQGVQGVQYTFSDGSTVSSVSMEVSPFNASSSPAITPSTSTFNIEEDGNDPDEELTVPEAPPVQRPNHRTGRTRNTAKAKNPKRPKPRSLYGGDIPGFLPYHCALPAHVHGLVQICRDFPNHLRDEILDQFLFWGWSYIDIWNHIKDSTVDEWVRIGVIDQETIDKKGFLSNRYRRRYSIYKAQGVTREQLLAMPKRFTSEIGYQNGLHCLNAKADVKNMSVVVGADEDVDENSPDQVNSNYQQDIAILDAADAQTEGDKSFLEFPMDFTQNDETPLGSFCGMNFWKAPGEYNTLLNFFLKTMQEADSNANEIIAANVNLFGVSASVKLDAKLALLAWNEESRQGYIGASATARSKKGDNGKVVLDAYLSEVYDTFLKTEAHRYMEKMPEVCIMLQNGVFEQEFIANMRIAVVKGFMDKMITVRKRVRHQWAELQHKRRRAARSIADIPDVPGGRKRRHDGEDANTNKKARLEPTTTPPVEVAMLQSHLEGAINTTSATQTLPLSQENSNEISVNAHGAGFSFPPLPELPADNEFDLPPLPGWSAADMFSPINFERGTVIPTASDAQADGNLHDLANRDVGTTDFNDGHFGGDGTWVADPLSPGNLGPTEYFDLTFADFDF